MPVEMAYSDIVTCLDRLADSYRRVESLLAEYLANMECGLTSTEAVEQVSREVERSAELLRAISSACPPQADPSSSSSPELADKKQQVLAILSRVLQSLMEAERRTEQRYAELMPQAIGLAHAQRLYQAYSTTLATWTPTAPSPVTAPDAVHHVPDDSQQLGSNYSAGHDFGSA